MPSISDVLYKVGITFILSFYINYSLWMKIGHDTTIVTMHNNYFP